ncbi:hypothetical protein F5887DRAFT_318203 [Amanita rubescens]|nr:hypothetical protein F5887DRAFT_318203 [Amanita rubescens]
MRRSWPLSTNPEFSVLECPGYFEYRVENWRLARDGSGRTITRISSLSWLDAILTAALSVTWLKATDIWLAPTVVVILFYIWWKCNQVLSESIVVLPSLGVQLETRRGSPLFSRPLFTGRRFIPLCALQDIIISEGLHRWDVRLLMRTCYPTMMFSYMYIGASKPKYQMWLSPQRADLCTPEWKIIPIV